MKFCIYLFEAGTNCVSHILLNLRIIPKSVCLLDGMQLCRRASAHHLNQSVDINPASKECLSYQLGVALLWFTHPQIHRILQMDSENQFYQRLLFSESVSQNICFETFLKYKDVSFSYSFLINYRQCIVVSNVGQNAVEILVVESPECLMNELKFLRVPARESLYKLLSVAFTIACKCIPFIKAYELLYHTTMLLFSFSEKTKLSCLARI